MSLSLDLALHQLTNELLEESILYACILMVDQMDRTGNELLFFIKFLLWDLYVVS
jgi:hypothetical protein